jgi:hypothetical protein
MVSSNYKEIAKLIIAHRKGELDQEGTLKLDNWCKADEKNKSLFERMHDEDYVLNQLSIMGSGNWEQLFQKIKLPQKETVIPIGNRKRVAFILEQYRTNRMFKDQLARFETENTYNTSRLKILKRKLQFILVRIHVKSLPHRSSVTLWVTELFILIMLLYLRYLAGQMSG